MVKNSNEKTETKLIPLAHVKYIQVREAFSDENIDEYRRAIEGGEKLPPVNSVYDEVNNTYHVWDGYHRGRAHEQLGKQEIEAEVSLGTERDAILKAAGANSTHGLPRTNNDKRRAVRTLLRDPEWGGWNNSEIARRCRVSDDLVAAVAKEDEFSERRVVEKKKVFRNGAETEMNTAQIGKKVSSSKMKSGAPGPRDSVDKESGSKSGTHVSKLALKLVALLCAESISVTSDRDVLLRLKNRIEICLAIPGGGS